MTSSCRTSSAKLYNRPYQIRHLTCIMTLEARITCENFSLRFPPPYKPSAWPSETVGQVGHLPYQFLVVHTGNDLCYDFYPT